MPVFPRETIVELTNGEQGIIPGVDPDDLRNLQEIMKKHPEMDTYGYSFRPDTPHTTAEYRTIFLKDIKSILSTSDHHK
jgi:hypothetical protein